MPAQSSAAYATENDAEWSDTTRAFTSIERFALVVIDGRDKACFVATACFDSPHQQTVITLRRFREVVLKKHTFGRALVKSYYRISPPLAEAIRGYPILRYPITIALALLAGLLRRCFSLN